MINSQQYCNTLLSIYDRHRALIKPLPFSRSLAEKFLWSRKINGKFHKTTLASGIPFYIYQDAEGLSKAIWLNGHYEKGTTELIAETLDKGDSFVDIGANIGYFTVIAANSVGGEGAVHSYEPISENVELLKRNIDSNNLKNVNIRESVVSSFSGEIEIGISARKGQHSTKKDFKERKKKKCVTLDEEIKQEIDLIKIDVEGAELQVIEGAMATIKRFKPAIILEYNPDSWSDEQIGDIFSAISDFYEFHRIERGEGQVIEYQDIVENKELSKNLYLKPKDA
jgi:FkbM family methyltransferase